MKWALFLTVSCLLPTTSPLPAYQPPYGEKLKPKPFRYEYGVQDTGHGTAFNKEETQDEEGNVFGSVVVFLPDGRIQTTHYNADFYDGYYADVEYAGTAQYPSEHHQPYNLPVHLQSRPIYRPTTPKPHQGFHNLYQQNYPHTTQPKNSPFRNHQQHPLQQQFKSLEMIIPELLDTAQARPEQVIFQSDKIRPVIMLAESARSQAQNNNKLQQNSMVEIMKNIRDDLKKENKPQMNIPNNRDNTMFVKANIMNSNAFAQGLKQNMNLKLKKSHTNSNQKSQEQIFQPRLPSLSSKDKMEELMKKIREDLKKNGKLNKLIVPSFKVEKMQPNFPSSMSAVAPSRTEISSEPEGMAEMMKQVRQNLKDLNKEPVITTKNNPKLEEAETSISMAKTIQKIRDDLKTSEKVMLGSSKSENQAFQSQSLGSTKAGKMEGIMKNIRDKLKETEKMSKPLIQTKLKTQEKIFEAATISSIHGPIESFQILDQNPNNTHTEKKMKDIMKNIRIDLMKTEKTKSVFPPESSKPSKTGNMSEIMMKIREDFKNIKREQISIPESNNNFVVTNKTPSDSKELREELQNSKLKTPAKSQNVMFHNRPLVAAKPDKTAEIMSKIREDLKKSEAIKPQRLPSLNPETPPLMIIKSHIIPGPDKKENLSAVMSIKPPQAESMTGMMEKIRQDLTRPSPEVTSDMSGGMMGIVMNIRKDLDKEEYDKDPAGPGVEILDKEFSTNNPLTDSVVDFMKKVELMKEKVSKPTINTMQVKTKVIKHEHSDLDVLPRTLPNREESINQVSN